MADITDPFNPAAKIGTGYPTAQGANAPTGYADPAATYSGSTKSGIDPTQTNGIYADNGTTAKYGASRSDQYLRPYDINPNGRGASYDGPVATPRYQDIGSGDANNAGFNHLMLELSQHFDPMIQQSVLKQPRWWHDRIPRSAYTLFNGVTHETRIYRGGLMKYAGLSQWVDINPVPSTSNNPCGALPYETYKYGWESLAWSGKKAAWGSDPICADTFKFFDQATQQLAWILATGAEYGIQMQEVWNRDMFIYQSVSFGRSFIMSSEFNGPTSARYVYNPFAKYTDDNDKRFNGKAFIVFPANTKVEPLNFDVLDQVRESLKIRCPQAAVSSAGGCPMFALAVSHDDIERYIRGNEEERKYWIEADPRALIQHYGFAPSTFRRWSITNDGNQLRFKIVKYAAFSDIVKNIDSKTKASFEAVFTDPTEKVYMAVAVDPLIPSTTRVGINNSPIPEDNPEYYTAELAIAPIFMNHVFTNQFVPSITSLGSGTKFGPVTGLNGNWGWMNIRDRETNPEGNIGNFYGKFEIVPKPETHVFHTISFLYRRCVSQLPSLCPAENVKVNVGATEDGLKTTSSTLDSTDTSRTVITITLNKATTIGTGDRIQFGTGESAPTGTIVKGISTVTFRVVLDTPVAAEGSAPTGDITVLV